MLLSVLCASGAQAGSKSQCERCKKLVKGFREVSTSARSHAFLVYVSQSVSQGIGTITLTRYLHRSMVKGAIESIIGEFYLATLVAGADPRLLFQSLLNLLAKSRDQL